MWVVRRRPGIRRSIQGPARRSADDQEVTVGALQGRSQGPVGCPAASTGWRPRCQRRWHCGQCDTCRQSHSHIWVPCGVVYVHRQCSPCLRHVSHIGTRVGMAITVGIRASTWSDVWRGTPGSDGLAMRQGSRRLPLDGAAVEADSLGRRATSVIYVDAQEALREVASAPHRRRGVTRR